MILISKCIVTGAIENMIRVVFSVTLPFTLTACGGGGNDAPTNDDSVAILSAFYGLNNGVPGMYAGCGLTGAQDGMPIVLDQQFPLPAMLEPSAFVVHRQSGAQGLVACATLTPAVEPEERRTILLIGEFASVDDPPVGVEIVESVVTDSGSDAKGAKIETVIPLDAGPSIVIAQNYSAANLATGGADECPVTTNHIIKTTWDGGVTGHQGADLDETQRLGTTIEYENGEIRVATVLADIADGDNHVEFCMSAPGDPVSITVYPGLYEDPNNDPNALDVQTVVDADDVGNT